MKPKPLLLAFQVRGSQWRAPFSPIILPPSSFQYDSPVTLALGDPLAIKVLKQRDRILARDAGKILKRSNVDGPISLVFHSIFQKLFLQTLDCVSMKEE